MADLVSPTDYDGITSSDLFDSFMDVALSAENYIKDYGSKSSENYTEESCSNGEVNTTDTLEITLQEINKSSSLLKNEEGMSTLHEPDHPRPLLVKTSEPVYETCGSKVNNSIQNSLENDNESETNARYATVNVTETEIKLEDCNVQSITETEKKTESPVQSQQIDLYATTDKIKIEHSNSESAVETEIKKENSVQENQYDKQFQKYSPRKSQPNMADLYATPDKTKIEHRTIESNVETEEKKEIPVQKNHYDQSFKQYSPKKSQHNVSDLYATPDKSKTLNDEESSTMYADVTNVNKQNGVTSKQVEAKNDYAEVGLNNVNRPSSEYEVISNYQKPLKDSSKNQGKLSNVSLSVTKSTDVLNAEQIAFGSHHLHSQGQKEMYSTITNTIERGNVPLSPRSASTASKEKRHFFGFGKKHSTSEPPTRTQSESTQRWSAEFNHDQTGHKSPSLTRQSSIPVLCSGYMFKQGGTGFTPKNWRLRWFELKSDNCLYYYKSEQEQMANGAVMLLKYAVARSIEVNKRFAFKLVKGGARTYFFAANSEEEMRKWMKNLGEAAKNAVSDHTSIPECSLKNVSIPALSITEPDCHGFLYKQGNSHKSWKKRYCVLKYGCLFYYEDMSNEVAIGVFKLHHYTITKTPNSNNGNSKYSFEATPPIRKMRTFHFYSETEIDFKRWVEAMKHSVASFKSS